MSLLSGFEFRVSGLGFTHIGPEVVPFKGVYLEPEMLHPKMELLRSLWVPLRVDDQWPRFRAMRWNP